MDSTIYEIGEAGPSAPSRTANPMANQRAYMLDGDPSRCPSAWRHLAGDGVGRGYIGDEQLAAAKFRDSPFPQSGPDLPGLFGMSWLIAPARVIRRVRVAPGELLVNGGCFSGGSIEAVSRVGGMGITLKGGRRSECSSSRGLC
jgi:hypothetical protein